MHGLMMDFPLTLNAIFRRATQMFRRREIVWRAADKSIHRETYAGFTDRARRAAQALRDLGLRPGDRAATLAWNHGPHLEAYFGIPLAGGVLHTLNLRLHPDELAYIVDHADDRVVLVDESLLPLWEQVRPKVKVKEVVVFNATKPLPPGAHDYEKLVAAAPPLPDAPDPDENTAAAMCYTTGTTGNPKGVLYSHRAIVLHTLGLALDHCMGMREADVVLPVVPMFHANAWGMPFTAVMVGSKIVLPGPHLDPESLCDLFQGERVTITGGVPTIWMGMMQFLDANPGRYDLSSMRAMIVGGSAVPQAMIEGFEKKYGLKIFQAWGMTEMAPLGTVAGYPCGMEREPDAVKYAYRAKQGRPAPFVEIRARGDEGLVPWDGQTMGELEVRGPWIASAYYNRPDAADRFTDDGWFRTGDIVTIDQDATIQVQDRSKDLIKSGGEWISSVALECALMGHPAVAEAAVFAVAHPKWDERPVAAVVLKPGQTASADDLKAFLAPSFAKFWLPDAFEFIDAIPRTSAGKFKKSALRERFKDYRFAEV
jgi:fatty-acyl-CoA synthase